MLKDNFFFSLNSMIDWDHLKQELLAYFESLNDEGIRGLIMIWPSREFNFRNFIMAEYRNRNLFCIIFRGSKITRDGTRYFSQN